MARRPTLKQKQVVAELLSHPEKTQTEAYMTVFPNVSRNVASAAASQMLAKPLVQEHIHAVLARKYPEMAETAANFLMDTLANPLISTETKLKVIDKLIKIEGWNAPTKVQNLNAKIDLTKFRLPGTKDE